MNLYLLRHATASREAPRDELRQLTVAGQNEARAAGQALARIGVDPGAILTSPLVRARQTAELAAKELSASKRIHVLDELANDAQTPELLKALRPYGHFEEIILVGHLPSMPEYIAALIGSANPDGIKLGKGAVACVQLESLTADHGVLRWLMGKKMLRLI